MVRLKNLHYFAKHLLLITLLAGCATGPGLGPSNLSPNEVLHLAKTSEAKGHFIIAAQNYLQLAEITRTPTREDYQLAAANNLLRGQYADRAKKIIEQITPETLSQDQTQRYKLINARLAILEGDSETAFESLKLSITDKTPAQIRIEWRTLLAEAYRLAGNHLESVQEYITLESLLTDSDAIHNNHEQIWATLNQLSEQALETLRKEPPPDVLSGWLELAYYTQASANNPPRLEKQIRQWQARYPGHPAADEFINTLFLSHKALAGRPQNIALLLPLSGAFKSPASAVRDGFLAAYYDRNTPNYAPEIRIYDTTDNIETGVKVYQQAIAEGADIIVGPLHKPLVERLASTNGFTIPTLALNYLGAEDMLIDNLYQYGLLPEDEARQVAERAWIDGHNRALALVPDGEWGNRILATFLKYWQQLDGVVSEVQRYDANQHDFSTQVMDLLNIHHSKGRYAQLKATLGRDIQYEPRRRQDIDYIFVAGFPQQVRQIRPQLKFFYAADIPVYSTSHAYAGERNPRKDRDMDGILFCDMPWVFTEGQGHQPNWKDFTRIWKSNALPYKRLYAMGIDAYHLIPRLEYLRKNPQEYYNAESGNLFLDEKQRIHRQLLWAEFKRGRPQLLDTSPLANKKAGT